MSSVKDVSTGFPAKLTSSYVGWSTPFHTQTTFKQIVATRTRSGERLPHWKRVIAEGGNATTPLSATWDSLESAIMTGSTSILWGNDPMYWHKSTINGDPLSNNRGPIPCYAPIKSITSADNRARAKFYKQLRSMAVQMSGPTFLGELGQTLHMLRRPAQALQDSLTGYLGALGKRKRSNPKDWTKAISGSWLEYSFGWVPLLNDCKDAYKAYNRLGEKPRTQVISVGAVDSFDRIQEIAGTFLFGSAGYGDNVVITSKNATFTEQVSVRYKGSVSAQAETTKWDNLALFGFTPSEFIPTAWELLPWSFLVDYFTNIGDILSAAVTDTSRVKFVNKTVRATTDYQATYEMDLKAMIALIGGGTGQGGSNPVLVRTRRKTVTRSAGVGISLPTFQVDLDLRSGQLGNIAALLGQSQALHPQSVKPNRHWPGFGR